jgi:hypothetical protein
MPRKDKEASRIEEPPHTIEVDDSENMVGTSLARIKQILKKIEKPGDALALYMVYKSYFQENRRVPSVPTLIKILGWGKDKLRNTRGELKSLKIIEDIKIKGTDGRFITTRTKLRGTDFPTVGKTPPNILKNIYTPDSAEPKSGGACSCSSCGRSKEKETPIKKFPREQDFNALWSINRRKVNKDEARKAWKSKPVQKSLPPKDVLLQAYEADAESNKWDERKAKGEEEFIPHLSTWIRNKRWTNYTGEPVGASGGTHIMDQLRRSDGIEDARHLRQALVEEYVARKGGNERETKKMMRAYVRWLEGPEPPPAVPTDSLRDVYVTDMAKSRYWKAYMAAGLPGLSKTEEF